MTYRPPQLAFVPWPYQKPDQFQLLERHRFVYNGKKLTIPALYITDFASVPRALWPLIPSVGGYWYASLVHDFLYDTRQGEAEFGARNARKLADLEFYRLLVLACPGAYVRNYLMYQAVRWGGRWKPLTTPKPDEKPAHPRLGNPTDTGNRSDAWSHPLGVKPHRPDPSPTDSAATN